jgi:hypothetical protein
MKNVNETKLEALNIAKQFNAGDIDELLNNAQKILNFVEYYVGDYPNILQEKKEKFINVVNRQLDKYNYKDPLRKEYARHAIVADYIDKRLKNGIQELCEEIDEEIGEDYTTVKPEYKDYEKLGEVYINGLVPTEKDSVFSSGDYVSPIVDKGDLQKTCKESDGKTKLILTHREEVDKELLTIMNEKVQEDIQIAKNNYASTKKTSNTPLVDAFIKGRANVSQTPMVIDSLNVKPFTDIRNIENDCFIKISEIAKQ